MRAILSSYDSLPHLEKLSLYPLDTDDELLELIIRKCPHLTSLKLFSWRTPLTHEGLSRIFSNFESLHRLRHLSIHPPLTQDKARLDDLLEIISKKCPHLESIDVYPPINRTRPFPWFQTVWSSQFSNSQLDSLTRRFPQTAMNRSWRITPYFASRRPSLFSHIVSKFR